MQEHMVAMVIVFGMPGLHVSRHLPICSDLRAKNSVISVKKHYSRESGFVRAQCLVTTQICRDIYYTRAIGTGSNEGFEETRG